MEDGKELRQNWQLLTTFLGSPDTCSGGKWKVELTDPSLASYVNNGELQRDSLMLLNPHLEHRLSSSIQTLLTLSFC